LKDFTSKFHEIIFEADKLIENNNYNKIEFYGIILCYLNFYNHKDFSIMIDDLFNKISEDLYEILLIYHPQFKRPINQNSDFFNKFIKYTIENKEFPIFKIALSYIKDLETFLDVIEQNKEGIFEKYKKTESLKNIIELGNNLKFKKSKNKDENKTEIIPENIEETNLEKINNNINQYDGDNSNPKNEKKQNKKKWDYFDLNIKKKIKSIFAFSKSKKVFLIYFRNDFLEKYIEFLY